KCRLTRCYAHGAGLVGFDLRAPGVEALIEHSLLVGSDQPLIRAAGYAAARTTVRIVRSTLVSAQQLIQLRPASANEVKPALSVLCWDALLAHAGGDSGGELFNARTPLDDSQLEWQSRNSLFTGWKTLFMGRKKSVPWSDFELAAWHRHWNQTEGAR